MVITFWKGVFVADVVDEKGALGKAGFQMHEPTVCNLAGQKCKACRAEIGRRYWTDKIESATRLRQFCNERALGVMREHLDRLERSRALDAKIAIPCPEGQAYLPYQRAGVAYALQRKDTLFGDDMGLGKSVEALGFINYTKPKNILVVCPKSIIFNWRNKAMDWLVDDYEVWPVTDKKTVVPAKDGLFVITNYEKITGKSPLAKSLARVWDVAIWDECHKLKNPDTQINQAVLGRDGLFYRTHRNLFLTGTPIENYPKEIWPIAAACCPVKFGDWWTFATRYCGLHQEEREYLHRVKDKKTGQPVLDDKGEQVIEKIVKTIWVTEGASNLPELQQRLRASFMVRRLKKDVLPELPPKRRELVILEDSKVDWSKHPQFVRWKQVYERKFELTLAMLESAQTDEEYREAALAMEKFTGIAFEEMSEFRKQTAMAKLPLCLAYVDELFASGLENVVIYGHHVNEVLKPTKEYFGDRAVLIHGGTSDKAREAAMMAFQQRKKQIFIGQMRAAGSGFDLTATDTVVFFEIDWNPGVLSQCEDRLCRIGQKKMVHVLHPILGNTLDVNMVQKIVAKQAVIDRALDTMPELKLKKRTGRQTTLPGVS